MKSKAYRLVDVKPVRMLQAALGRDGQDLIVGIDMGKRWFVAIFRWGNDDFGRPWRVDNPGGIREFVEGLKQLQRERRLIVALEPTGTYGDPLRQALHRRGIETRQVRSKHAKDFAETFDGVPSQHDGKDAAVVAELAAIGKSVLWKFEQLQPWESELRYWVVRMDASDRQSRLWYGRMEGLLARHWPEATRILKVSSGVLLRCLEEYGGPERLAKAADGLARIRKWGGPRLSAEKAQALWESARTTVGVAMEHWVETEIRDIAMELRDRRQEVRRCGRKLRGLGSSCEELVRMGSMVGVPTACVLWAELGPPSRYHCGEAYRKAMGLNLKERSSGAWAGKLRLTKRGSSRCRRWLYFAALRLLHQEPVRSWYAEQVRQRRGEGKPAVIGVMRRLAKALYQIGGRGQEYVPQKLFAPQARQKSASKKARRAK